MSIVSFLSLLMMIEALAASDKELSASSHATPRRACGEAGPTGLELADAGCSE